MKRVSVVPALLTHRDDECWQTGLGWVWQQ